MFRISNLRIVLAGCVVSIACHGVVAPASAGMAAYEASAYGFLRYNPADLPANVHTSGDGNYGNDWDYQWYADAGGSYVGQGYGSGYVSTFPYGGPGYGYNGASVSSSISGSVGDTYIPESTSYSYSDSGSYLRIWNDNDYSVPILFDVSHVISASAYSDPNGYAFAEAFVQLYWNTDYGDVILNNWYVQADQYHNYASGNFDSQVYLYLPPGRNDIAIQGHAFGFDGMAASNSLPSSVPEPSSFALLGLGGIGLVFNAYRRRRLAV